MSIWKTLESMKDLQSAAAKSHETPVVIYKHSTRCGTSVFVKKRLEHDWDLHDESVEIHLLDLITYRDVSDEVERRFGVRHESPQILVIRNGRSIFDTSHGDVSVQAIRRALRDAISRTEPNGN